MKRKLATIAKSLSEEDIQELIRLKKTDDKRVVSLRKKRDKVAATLEKLDAEIALNVTWKSGIFRQNLSAHVVQPSAARIS